MEGPAGKRSVEERLQPVKGLQAMKGPSMTKGHRQLGPVSKGPVRGLGPQGQVTRGHVVQRQQGLVTKGPVKELVPPGQVAKGHAVKGPVKERLQPVKGLQATKGSAVKGHGHQGPVTKGHAVQGLVTREPVKRQQEPGAQQVTK